MRAPSCLILRLLWITLVVAGDTDKDGKPHGHGFFIRRGKPINGANWGNWHRGDEMCGVY